MTGNRYALIKVSEARPLVRISIQMQKTSQEEYVFQRRRGLFVFIFDKNITFSLPGGKGKSPLVEIPFSKRQ
jgi:hypothetical protein